MVQIVCEGVEWGWGVVVNVRKSAQSKGKKLNIVESHLIRPVQECSMEYVMDVLLEVSAQVADSDSEGEGSLQSMRPRAQLEELTAAETPLPIKYIGTTLLVHVVLDCLGGISAVRLNLPKDITTAKAKAGVMKAVAEVNRRFTAPAGTGVPLLDYITDLAIPADTIQPLLTMRDDIVLRMEKSDYHSLPDKEVAMEAFKTKSALLREADNLASKARESQAVAMREELKKMKRVLRRLDFISADNVLELKGRFSCELSTADELVATNMVFDGAFNDLSVPQIVALLSCFVHKEENKDPGNPQIRPDMQTAFRGLQAVARGVAKVCADAKLIVDEEEYVNSFNPGLVNVTYAWCTGAKFAEICKLTDTFEGSIIRVLRRLEELLRQLAAASLSIGNAELKEMFEDGARRIRRGVVFAASLYL